MQFIKKPNCPENKVSHVLLNGEISNKIKDNLANLGVKAINVYRDANLHEAVCCHPDMIFHHVTNDICILPPSINLKTKKSLISLNFKIVEGGSKLQPVYPLSISYNIARVGKYAIHNLKFTDDILKRFLDEEGVEWIDVKQGYSKCSVSIVNENTIITEDIGIARQAEKKGIEVLLIQPEPNILLPGLNKGFLGGSTGLLNKDVWAITGNIEKLKCCEKIRMFLADKKVDILCLSDDDVIDVGSIIPLLQE